MITDSAGTVYASSQNLIGSGEEIRPYLVDTSLFAAAARENRPIFTPLSEIDGVHFQSLYFPFTLRDKRQMVVLESDQDFIAYVEQFRTYLVFASLFLLALFAVLTAGLFALERRFQAALAVSRRNEQLAFLGRTSAELAHELKNPLAIMKASVDVLRNKLDPERKEAAFGYLSEETMRLSRLIGNILGFSKDRPLQAKLFSPREALLQSREAHRSQFPGGNGASGCRTISPSPATPICSGKWRRTWRATRPMPWAARETLQRNGCLTLIRRLESPPERDSGGAFRFSDTGPGLPKAVRARLFEPFVSGSRTGTGLGLSIVKNLCERMGWTLDLISDAGSDTADGGTRMCFEIKVPKVAKTQTARARRSMKEAIWP